MSDPASSDLTAAALREAAITTVCDILWAYGIVVADSTPIARDIVNDIVNVLEAAALATPPLDAIREARNQGYREGRLAVWLEVQEAANDGVKLARRILEPESKP